MDFDAQEKINSDGKLRIFKTHNGNYNFLGKDFTNKKNTLAVIYIVRDPRNMLFLYLIIINIILITCSVRILLDEKNVLFNKMILMI